MANNKLTAFLILLLGATVTAAAIVQNQINNQGITLIGNFTAYVNGVQLLNGTTLQWGNAYSGTLTRTLSIHNNDTVARNYTLFIFNLPPHWTETLSNNMTTAQPNQWTNGTLTLMIPSNATRQSYTFGNMLLIAQ